MDTDHFAFSEALKLEAGGTPAIPGAPCVKTDVIFLGDLSLAIRRISSKRAVPKHRPFLQ